MCIKSFPFAALMNISQGLKLRWDCLSDSKQRGKVRWQPYCCCTCALSWRELECLGKCTNTSLLWRRFVFFLSLHSLTFACFYAFPWNSHIYTCTAYPRGTSKNSPHPKGVSSCSLSSLSPLATPEGIESSWIEDCSFVCITDLMVKNVSQIYYLNNKRVSLRLNSEVTKLCVFMNTQKLLSLVHF